MQMARVGASLVFDSSGHNREPLPHHIQTRPRDPVNVMRHNGLTKQLKANAPCVMHALLIDPDSSAVIVSTNDGIISQQKATSQGKTHHLHDGNIIRRKYLNACQSSQTSH